MIAGALGSHLFTALPPPWLLFCFSILGLAVLLASKIRWLAVALLACCWCLLNFQRQLDDRLDPALAGTVAPISGVISSIPRFGDGYARFRFDPEDSKQEAGLPGTLLVHWYEEWPELAVGQRWELDLKLKPPWGRVNFQGPDKERWLFAQGIGGIGTVRKGRLLAEPSGARFVLQSLRSFILRQVSDKVADERARGIVQALATADRSGLSTEDRRLLTVTGTSHLLAISGLHVGLAAAGGIWLGRLVLWLLPFAWSGRAMLSVSIGSGLLTAAMYAALAGFGTGLGSMLLLRPEPVFESVHAWITSFAVLSLVVAGLLGRALERGASDRVRRIHLLCGATGLLAALGAAAAGMAILP